MSTGCFVAKHVKTLRADRTHPCCSSSNPKDELHVGSDCTAYSSARAAPKFAGMFSDARTNDIKTLFCHLQHQGVLGDCVWAFPVRPQAAACFFAETKIYTLFIS